MELLEKYREKDGNNIINRIEKEIFSFEKISNINFNITDEIKEKNIICIYEFLTNILVLTNKMLDIDELLKKIITEYKIQNLADLNLSNSRKKIYQKIIDILALQKIESKNLNVENIVHKVKNVRYLNLFLEENASMVEIDKIIKTPKKHLNENKEVIVSGICTYEINPNKSIYKAFVHSILDEKIRTYLVKEIMKKVGDETVNYEKILNKDNCIVARIFTSLDKPKMIKTYLTNSIEIINKLETYSYKDRSVDMLHYISDFLEFPKDSKSILEAEIIRSKKDYKTTIEKAEEIANKIYLANRKLETEDINKIIEELELFLTTAGKESFEGVLRRIEKENAFENIINNAFPIETKNMTALRMEVEEIINDDEKIDQINKEMEKHFKIIIEGDI